jgi:hypothetical protein
VGTGLIFAAVVIAWAVFLVPWALRRYDEATRARSVERFSSTLRVLRRARREADVEDEAVAEPETEPAATRPALRPEPTGTQTPIAAPVRPSRAAARAAARRRRRVLLTLLTLTVGTGLVAAVALVPPWAVAIPAAFVVSFLALCRWQVRREDDAIWARRRAAEPESDAADPVGDEPDDEPTVVLGKASADVGDGVAGRHPVEADAEPVGDADLAESTNVAVTVSTQDGSSLWDPLPVTLPTYVSKAKATRTVRTIDLGQPDAWTSGHVEGEQTELPSDAPAADASNDESAGDSDAHRPAVGD